MHTQLHFSSEFTILCFRRGEETLGLKKDELLQAKEKEIVGLKRDLTGMKQMLHAVPLLRGRVCDLENEVKGFCGLS
jgi:hypothetical protein